MHERGVLASDSGGAAAWGQTEAGARKFYDGIADEYDRHLEAPATHAVRECFWKCAEAMLPPSARILDYGAGTGIDALHFAQLGNHVTAYDLSEGMLAVLKRRAAQQVEAGTIEPISGSWAEAQEQLVARAPFDAVLCNFAVFSMIPNLEPVLRLFGKVVRPGGVALISVQNPWNPADMRTRGFWRALVARPFLGVMRYRNAESHYIYHHTPAAVRRDALPDFAADASPPPPCCRRSFGWRSHMRLVALRRL